MCFQRIKILCGIISIVPVLALTASAVDGDTHENNLMAVAVVDGSTIYQRDIEINKEEVKAFIVGRETDNLYVQIKHVIEANAIKRFGIHVTKEEVAKSVDSMFERAGIDENKAKSIVQMYRVLLASLEKWQADNSQSTKIYDENLKIFMSKPQWLQWQKGFPSPEKLVELRRLIPQDTNDMKANSFASSEQDLLHAKFIDHITSEVRVTEDEVLAIYSASHGDNEEKELRLAAMNKIKTNILEEKKKKAIEDWWQNSIQSSTIKIENKDLQEVWNKKYGKLLKPVSAVPSAQAVP